MAAAANDQVKLRKRLEALLKLPDNQTCADCRKRGPRWASANLGIFICIECSGIHRNLGVHISFVRSVNLDSWTKQQVDFMEEWGNRRANEYWEANVPAHVTKPKEGDAVRVVERYIRDKYEFKRYVASSLPPKNSESASEAEEVPATTAAPTRRQSAAPTAAAKVSKPVEQPVSLPPKVAPSAAPSLLDFDEPVVIPAAAQPVAHASAQPSTSGNGDLFSFDAFQQAPPVPSQPTQHQPAQNNGFGDFSADPFNQGSSSQPNVFGNFGQPAQQAQQQAKPQASADAILSLYANNMGRGPPMPMAAGFNQQQQPMYNTHHAQPVMLNNGGMQGHPRPMMGGMGGPQYGQIPGQMPPMNPFMQGQPQQGGHMGYQQPQGGMGMGMGGVIPMAGGYPMQQQGGFGGPQQMGMHPMGGMGGMPQQGGSPMNPFQNVGGQPYQQGWPRG